MSKSVVALLSLFVSISASAQIFDKADGTEQPLNGNSINIAVSKYDITAGNSFFETAEQLESKNNYNEALTLYGKAAFEYNVNKNLIKYGQSVMKMAQMHFLLGRYTDAEQIYLNVALKNYSKLGNRVGLMNTYYQLGKVYLAANKYTQSLWFYTQQGILAQQLKNNFSYIESVLGIANVKLKKKEFLLASRDVNRAELLAKSSKTSNYNIQIKDLRTLIANKNILK